MDDHICYVFEAIDIIVSHRLAGSASVFPFSGVRRRNFYRKIDFQTSCERWRGSE